MKKLFLLVLTIITLLIGLVGCGMDASKVSTVQIQTDIKEDLILVEFVDLDKKVTLITQNGIRYESTFRKIIDEKNSNNVNERGYLSATFSNIKFNDKDKYITLRFDDADYKIKIKNIENDTLKIHANVKKLNFFDGEGLVDKLMKQASNSYKIVKFTS